MALDKIKTDVITDDAITVAKMNTDTGVQPEHHKVPVYANNSARDSAISSPADGMIIYNTAAQALQQYNGSWSAIEPAPVLTSISPTEVESAAGGTVSIVITGANFKSSGMSVSFIANSGSDITSGITVTHTSSTSITATLNKNLFVDANEPYDVKVTSAGGLSATLDDVLRVDNAPSFSASANTIVATIQDNATNATHATIAATDAESDAITFSEVGTTLYDKFTSATPRGVQSDGTIKGVPADVSSDETTTFTVRATSTGDGGATTKTTDQNFRFTITDYVALFSGKIYEATNSSGNSVDFPETNPTLQPDFLWFKSRDNANSHALYDSVRGINSALSSNSNAGANTSASSSQDLVSFDSDGFTLGTVGQMGSVNEIYNGNGSKVAWGWKAGGPISGSPSQATSNGQYRINGETTDRTATSYAVTGSGYAKGKSSTGIEYEASYNVGNGFAIIKTTSNGTNAGSTFPTFVGKPDFMIMKRTDAAGNWVVYHSALGTTSNTKHTIYLDLQEKQDASTLNVYGAESTMGANSGRTWDLGPNAQVNSNASGTRYIYYLWKSVSGLSKFGTYEGTAGAWTSGNNGGAQDIGFKPRLVIVKNADEHSRNWVMHDSFRVTSDTKSTNLYSNLSLVDDQDSSHTIVFDNNGFKFTSSTTYTHMNESNKTFIYMAWA